MTARRLFRSAIVASLVLPTLIVPSARAGDRLPPARIISNQVDYRSAPVPEIPSTHPARILAPIDALPELSVPEETAPALGSEGTTPATDRLVPATFEDSSQVNPSANGIEQATLLIPPAPAVFPMDEDQSETTRPLVFVPPAPPSLFSGIEPEAISSQPPPEWTDSLNPLAEIEHAALGGHGQSRVGWRYGGGDRIGSFFLEEKGVLAPATPDSMHFMFGHMIQFLDGPSRTDLPARLFGVNYGMQWRDHINSDWEFEFAIAPGFYSDFEDSAREGLRFQGRGLVYYQSNPEWQWVAGFEYLDRETVKLLPVLGAIRRIYTVSGEHSRLELVFPRPAYRQLIERTSDREEWFVISGSFEGDSFAIERQNGAPDVMTLDEFKIGVAYEWSRDKGRFQFLELSYLFGRELRYRSGIGNYDPGNTAMLTWGTHF